ncbi:MAG: PIN domain-containing protein [Treponema sp.]|nr:PIN domain-containing protein [Treponema sp.]
MDILLQNQEFHDESLSLLSLSDSGIIDFFISSASITDIYYIARKYIKDEKEVRNHLSDLLEIISIAGIDEYCIKNALSSSWKDFEDAVQNEAASQIAADYIVTRNTKDFKNSFTEVITPSVFLEKISKQ